VTNEAAASRKKKFFTQIDGYFHCHLPYRRIDFAIHPRLRLP
jgi:hypothetical protein